MLLELDAIRAIAHEIWITEGHPDGRALDHWLEAQRKALAPTVSTPWYDARSMANEIEWMRRALWHPQPYAVN